jgi:hypothetical protein
MPAPRRATQPQRRFSPEALATLARDHRRKLVQVLLTESGSGVVEVHRPAYDELILETRPLWRPLRVRVCVAARPSTQDDVDRLAEIRQAEIEASVRLARATSPVLTS